MDASRSLPVFGALLGAAGLAAAVVSCVPDTFTYEGSGGASSSSSTGGGSGQCGDGTVDEGEQCDLGLGNNDDHHDDSLEDSDESRGCSRSCQYVVQWSRAVDSAEVPNRSMVTGLAPTSTSLYVGGIVADEALDFFNARFSAVRLYAELSPDTGEVRLLRADRDTNALGESYGGNAIFAMTPGPQPNEVYALESVHEVGARVETYVRLRRDNVTVWDSPAVAAPEWAYAAFNAPDSQGRVPALGFVSDGIRLSRVLPDGTRPSTEATGALANIDANGPGAVVSLPNGDVVAVWRSAAARIGGNNEGVLFSSDVGAALEREVRFTGACAFSSTRFALAGWARVDDQYDGIVVVLDSQLEVLDHKLFAGERGGADGFNSIACDTDGSFVVTGEESTLEDPASAPDSLTTSRVVLKRYGVSPSGELSVRWERSYESPVLNSDGVRSDNDGYAVAIGPDRSVYVGGRKQLGQSRNRAWVRKYAP